LTINKSERGCSCDGNSIKSPRPQPLDEETKRGILSLAFSGWSLREITRFLNGEGVAATYDQVRRITRSNGIKRYQKQFTLKEVLENREAVETILRNINEAMRKYGYSNKICSAVRRTYNIRKENPADVALRNLYTLIQTERLLDSKTLSKKFYESLPIKPTSTWTWKRAASQALKEGWMIKSSNSSLEHGFLYATPEHKGKVIEKSGVGFYFDPAGRSIGDLVADIIDAQPQALTVEEVFLHLRDRTGLSFESVKLGKLMRKSKRIRVWGINHRLSRSYVYYTRSEQLEKRLANKETLLCESLRLVYENTRDQCLTVGQCATICHLSEDLVRHCAKKLNMLGLRKTEVFLGLRLIWDPALPDGEVALTKERIERELQRRAEERQIKGDVFACYGAFCILLDQQAHNLQMLKVEMHFGRHAFDVSDLHILGRQGLANEKIIAEFKSTQLKINDARRFCEKLRHEFGVTKAFIVYRDATAKAINYITYFRDAPLQWITAAMIAKRYEELMGFKLKPEDFSRFLEDRNLGFAYLKEVLEHNPNALKLQLVDWMRTRSIDGSESYTSTQKNISCTCSVQKTA